MIVFWLIRIFFDEDLLLFLEKKKFQLFFRTKKTVLSKTTANPYQKKNAWVFFFKKRRVLSEGRTADQLLSPGLKKNPKVADLLVPKVFFVFKLFFKKKSPTKKISGMPKFSKEIQNFQKKNNSLKVVTKRSLWPMNQTVLRHSM